MPPTCSHAAVKEEHNADTGLGSPQGAFTEFLPTVKAAVKQETSQSPSRRPNKRRRVASASSDSSSQNETKAKERKPTLEVKQDATKGDTKKVKLKKLKAKEPERRKLLNEESIRSRIALIGFEVFPIPVDAALASLTATRYFLSSFLGGGPQATFSRTSKDHRNPKKRNFMALKTEWNPHAPLIPGAPGLYFDDAECPDYSTDPDHRLTVFIHVEGSQWLYVGDYRLGRAPQLSVDEWLSLDKTVKLTWCAGSVQYSWGWRIRAAIALRERLGREPTRNDFKEVSGKEDFSNVTPEQIREEFDVGREHIQIWTMKCVGYEEEIRNTIAAHSADWEAARTARLAESRKTAKREDGDASRGKKNGRLAAKKRTTASLKRGTKSESSSTAQTPKKEETETDLPRSRPKHNGVKTATPLKGETRKRARVDSDDSGSDIQGNDSDDDYVPSWRAHD